MIPSQFIERLLERVDILELISRYVTLKRAGASYKALCPFHSEKTPSFVVTPSKSIFHCFGCGEGGDAISFIRKYEGLSFVEAARRLAQIEGIDLPEDSSSGRRPDNSKRLYQAIDEAMRFYHENLLDAAENSPARLYVRKREISDELIDAYKIGWAPPKWDGLKTHLLGLKKLDLSAAELVSAGLVFKSSKGKYLDYFRDRLIFPIRNSTGATIGFGARLIDQNSPIGGAGKYINSPTSRFYNKSEALYGYHEALDEARSKRAMIVVEGYLDLLALASIGIKNVCAISGTALTNRQVRLIKRVADQVIILFDGDQAGREAVKKSAGALFQERLESYVAPLPDREDPDSYLRARGPAALKELLRTGKPYMEHIVEEIFSNDYEKLSINEKIKAARSLAPIVAAVRDDLERAQYISYIAERTRLAPDRIERAFRARPARAERALSRPEPSAAKRPEPAELGVSRAADIILAIELDRLENATAPLDRALTLSEDDFPDGARRDLYRLILKERAGRARFDRARLMAGASEAVKRLIATLSAGRNFFDNHSVEEALRECALRLKRAKVDIDAIKREMVEAARSGDEEELKRATEKYFEKSQRNMLK